MKTENLSYNLHYDSSFKHNAKAHKHNVHTNVTKLEQNEYKNDKIELNRIANKTTAGENLSGRLSFKGAPQVAEKTVEELSKTFGGKLAKNKVFNWFLEVVAENSLIADALIALGLTAIARPASIYAIPTKDPVEKKKNNYQVAHSVATGVLGLGFTIALAEPIKRGVKKLLENPSKYMKTEKW